jgi:ubiquinone/menaquinone biosynthesis C-methylase UbiE
MKRDYGDLEKDFLFLNFNFKSKKILEIGCGDAYYTELFLSIAKECVVIEPDKQKIEEAGKKLSRFKDRVKILHGLTESFLNTLDTDFDVIVFSYSLHHHDNPEQILKEVLPLLKKGGLIIIMEPVFEGEYCQFMSDFHDESIVLKRTDEILNNFPLDNKKMSQIEVNWFFNDEKDVENFFIKFSVSSDLILRNLEKFPKRKIILKDIVNIWEIKK